MTCRCNLPAVPTVANLRPLEGGCTSPQFVCPTLDTIRRQVVKREEDAARRDEKRHGVRS